MSYTENSRNIPITCRSDDNLKFSVKADYDLTPYAIQLLVETRLGIIDLSQYCVKTDTDSFTVDIPSSVMNTLVNALRYKVAIILDGNNTDVLFGGKMIVERGIVV